MMRAFSIICLAAAVVGCADPSVGDGSRSYLIPTGGDTLVQLWFPPTRTSIDPTDLEIRQYTGSGPPQVTVIRDARPHASWTIVDGDPVVAIETVGTANPSPVRIYRRSTGWVGQHTPFIAVPRLASAGATLIATSAYTAQVWRLRPSGWEVASSPTVEALSTPVGAGGSLYLLAGAGSFVSADEGTSWQPSPLRFHVWSDVRPIVDGARWFLVGQASYDPFRALEGRRSVDGGQTLERLTVPDGAGPSVVSVAARGPIVVMITKTGVATMQLTGRRDLCVSTDGGVTFSHVGTTPIAHVLALANRFVGVDGLSDLYESADGVTWTRLP